MRGLTDLSLGPSAYVIFTLISPMVGQSMYAWSCPIAEPMKKGRQARKSGEKSREKSREKNREQAIALIRSVNSLLKERRCCRVKAVVNTSSKFGSGQNVEIECGMRDNQRCNFRMSGTI
jgi:hypothetical protein